MTDAAQPEECAGEGAGCEHRGIDRTLPAGTEGSGEHGQSEQEVRRPGGCAQRNVESVLERLVQRARGYFPFVAKYISISPSMITKATAAATGP